MNEILLLVQITNNNNKALMSDGIDGYVLMERDFRINMFK